MMPEIEKNWAACIVYYQDQDSILSLLKSLENQSLKPKEVFIADNNSKKLLQLDKYSFSVFITRLDENNGFASGANVAIKAAIARDHSNLMLLSQDVLLEIESSEIMLRELTNSGGIVFPTMWNRRTNVIFSKGGKVNKYLGSVKLSKLNVPPEPDWADGSCLMFSKNTYEAVQGFYEKFFMYFEDVEFCLKAKDLGFKISHVETKASQNPNGPNSYLRSRNSILLARRTKSSLFKISITKRNFFGVLLLIMKFRFYDSSQRLRGIYAGWRAPIV
jgi:GT2 family glycosyltransferase